MKTLTSLSASPAVDPEWREPRGVVSAVHLEIPGTPAAPGERPPVRFLHVALQSKGVVFFSGDTAIAFPMDELLKLALANEPAFATPVAAPAAPVNPSPAPRTLPNAKR